MRTFLDNSGLLVAGGLLALAWANIDPSSYAPAANALRFAVNDIGMAFFFALAAKEVVEATAPGGPLHSLRRASLPIIAAVGGMAGPAIIYIGLSLGLHHRELLSGWAIPTATDIAFSYLVARAIFGARHPGIPFLLLLAIADDALGLVVLALFYPTGVLRPLEFTVILGAAVVIAWQLRRRRVLNFWPYMLGAGAVSWAAFYRGGIHPALALVPIVAFLPHAARHPGFFVDSHDPRDTLGRFEHAWKIPVQVILFFFGLANAGVAVSGAGAGTWIVLAAILIGKPLGILSATSLSVASGLRRPEGVTWRELTVLAVITGIGFTVALFFAAAALPAGPLLDQVKMGALLSIGAAPIAVVAARLLNVGRISATARAIPGMPRSR